MSAETSHITDISGGASGTAATPKKPQQAKRVEVSPTPASASANSSSQKRPALGAAAWPTLPSMDVTKFFEESRERLREAFEQANGRFDTFRSAARDTGDVCQECQAAALTGIKDLSEQVFENVQSEMDRGYEFLRSATEAKGVGELMQLQADYIRESMGTQVEQGKALTELTVSLFKSTFAPWQAGLSTIMDNARKRS
jgi:hypothetical protein